MSKFTFNFKITPALVVEYELPIPPFHAALRENKLALTSTASDAEESTVRERADQVARNLARGLSYEHSQRFDNLIGGGVFDGSTTMVVGVSGVGKTVLSTQI